MTMRSEPRITLNPATLLAPAPAVMVSCAGVSDALRKPNIITLAWVGTVCSEPPMLSISVRPSRFSYAQIVESREFVVNLVGQKLMRAMDYCGVKSGRDVDKFKQCSLTPAPMEGLALAPAIAEAPVSLGCALCQVISLGSHDLFLAEIRQVTVDPALMDAGGKLRFSRADLVAFSHGEYVALGEALGFMGYSVASPEALGRRMAALKEG